MITQHPQLSHPKYRPDIDGLRAVAVIAVVAFHAFPTYIKGGFVGVDVFFVISGYLISTIIFENLDKGTFSFSEFYARRVKRIFPALLLVLIASYAFGWFALLADEYKQLGKHLAASAGFVSNFVLWGEAGYFDNSAETKPLLHLWSLGIEEQFYIVWPLLLWLAWKRNFNLLIITIIVALISFVLNVKGVKQDAVATFYSPQTRFWELLSGSLLAWITLYKKGAYIVVRSKLDSWLVTVVHRDKLGAEGKILSNLLSFIGLFLLVYGFWEINREFSFPGKWAVVPVLGAVLIISAGQKAWVNRIILSNKIAVWFGLISFPLYLWHWPLLTFARILESETPSRIIRIATVIISVVLAWLSYKFLERPIRLGEKTKVKVISLVFLMSIILGIGIITKKYDGLPLREVNELSAALSTGRDGGVGGNMLYECGIEDDSIKKLFAICAKDGRGNIKYALLGDSKAHALYPGLVRTSVDKGRWMFIGGNGPNGAPVPLLPTDPNSRPLTVAAVEAIAKNKDVEKVVFVTAIRALFKIGGGVKGGNLATYDYTYLKKLADTQSYKETYEGLERSIQRFINSGKKVVLVIDNPALPNPQDCIHRRTSLSLVNKFLGKKNLDCFVPLNNFLEQTRIYRKMLGELRASYPDSVQVFDPTEIYCEISSGICGPSRNGRVLYSYTDHISDYAAGLVGAKLNEYLNQH